MSTITKICFTPGPGGVKIQITTTPPGVHRSAAAALASWINAAGIRLDNAGGPILDAAGKVDPGASLLEILHALNASGIRARIDAAGGVEIIQ